jgi:hypothetical protein
MVRKTAYAIAKGEEPPWDAFYAPPDMHHYLKKTADAITRGEKPPYGGFYAPSGLYAPPTDPCVANPPAEKGTGKDKSSSPHRKNG